MSADFIYTNLPVYSKKTPNDVIILANAAQVTDAGRIAGLYPYAYVTYSTRDTESDFQALAMTGSDVTLVIGGDYSGDAANPYNLYYRTVNARYASAAVRFSGDATVSFNSQAGAALASANSDDNMRFGVSAYTSYTRGATYNSDTPGVTDASAAVFDAQSNTLTIDGDISGTFEASSSVGLYGITTVSSSTVTPINLSSNNTVGAAAFTAGKLVIGNNFKATFDIDANDSEIHAFASLTASGNTITASGIAAEESVECLNGEWSGAIDAEASGNTVSAVIADLYSEITTFTPAAMSGNEIGAYGVEAGDSIEIASMTGAAITATVSGNTLIAEANGGTSAGSLTFTGNTIAAAALTGETVALDEVSDSATLSVSALDNTIDLTVRGVSNSLSFSGNTVSARAISAGTIELGDFDGALFAESSGNTLTFSGSWTSTSGGYLVTAAGLYAEEAITVTGDLAGTISITLEDNSCSGGSFSNSGALLLAAYGITGATSITVNGQFTSEIDVTVSGNSGFSIQIAYGVKTETLTAGAFSGSITVNADSGYAIGIQVSDTFVSSYANDAFDINGTVSASDYGIVSMGTLNLRISGSVSATYAVTTEGYFDEDSATFYYTTSNNADKLDLSDTAVVNGAIDLGGGINSITIASGASVNGELLASNGELNITFALSAENADGSRAIVSTGLGDVSLVSTASTLTVNLNDALTDAEYTLFSYSGDAYGYWANKSVTFICQGQTLTTTLVNGEATVTLNGVTVTIGYDQSSNTVSVVTGSGDGTVADLPEFGNVSGTLTDGALSLTWSKSTLGGTYADSYEIEYRIYDSDGNAVGESVVVTVAGTAAATQSFSLSSLSLNAGETVEYRIRAGSGGGAYLSQWSETKTGSLADADPTLNASLAMTAGSASITSPGSASGGITSSTVEFSWAAATSDLAIDCYAVLYVESETELEIASWTYDPESGIYTATDSDGNTHNAYYKLVTGTSTVASELTNQRYVYWAVCAVDEAGNLSNFIDGQTFRIWTGDTTAPVFSGATPGYAAVTVNSEDAYNITYSVTFQWTAATDLQSGVYQYIVEYSADGTNWTRIVCDNTTFSASVSSLAGGLYEYRIYAVDYVGNQSAYAVSSSFGSADTTPPDGEFTSFAASVSAEYTTTTVSSSSSSTSGFGSTTSDSTTTITVKTHTDASATMSWSDTFTDDSEIVYTVEVCASASFTGKVYTFTTTDQSLTLSWGTTGETIGVLAGMGTVYWRLSVADSAGNTNPSYSATQSFRFVDDEGDAITLSYTLAKPTDLTATTDGDSVTFSWTDATTLGTYSFILSYTVNGKTYTVSDISDTSYTVDGLASGVYTWKVSALSTNLSSTATTSGTKFTIDSVAPEDVVVESVVGLKNNVIFTWDASVDDFSGVAYYVLKYKNVNASSYTTITTADTSYVASFTSNGSYEYQIYAVDGAGNTSGVTSGTFTVDTRADFGDTFAAATAITSGTTDTDQTIGGNIDTADFLKFSVAANSDVSITISNLADLIGSGSGLTVKVYAANQKTVLKSLSISSKNELGELSLFLESGDYYISITPKKSSVVSSYDITLEIDAVNCNNSDDTPATATALTFSAGTAATAADWVGFGDAIDYYSFTIASDSTEGTTAGNYTFSLADFTSGNAVITVYVEDANGNLKKLKSFTVTDKTSALTISNLLNGDYYVSVSSASASKASSAKNSDYTLTVTASDTYPLLSAENNTTTLDKNGYAAYTVGDDGEAYVLSFTGSGKYTVYVDNGKGGLTTLSVVNGNVVVSAGTTVYIKSSTGNNTLTVSETAYADESGDTLTLGTESSGWCGGADTGDSWYFTSDGAGWADFSVALDSSLGNAAKLTVTLYEYVDGSWKKVKSVTAKSTADLTTLGASLNADTDYKLVVSGGSAKNAATYTIESSVSLYTADDNSFETATPLSGDGTVTGTVVKKSDAADYYDLSDFAEGKLEWTQLSGSVKVTFYDENGNKVSVTASLTSSGGTTSTKTGSSFTLSGSSLSSLLLDLADSGAVYLKVEAAGSGNNSYSLTTSDTVSALESSLSSLLLTDATDLTAALAATGETASTLSLLSATDSDTTTSSLTSAVSASTGYETFVATSLVSETDETTLLKSGTLLA